MRITHWLMSVIIIALLCVGFYMADFLDPQSPIRGQIYHLHKSFGALIIFLITYRIFLRFTNDIPALPKTINPLQKKLAKGAQFLLYLLMICMPLSGYLMSNAAGYPVKLFVIELPALVGKDPVLGKFFHSAHHYLGYAFVIILSLHIAGALKHRFFDKPENDVLKRML